MNVIWVVSDTLRRDYIGSYGNKFIHTPAMDSFAAKSTRFDRQYIAGFPTMPTRADHMSGRFTASFMNWEPLPKDLVTLPQILTQNGIHTAAVVDPPFYTREGMNYDRGFQTYFEVIGQNRNDLARMTHAESMDIRYERRYEKDYCAPKTFSRAMQWLELHYKEDFFLYVDVWDPHEPWDAPNYYTEQYYPQYDGEPIDPPYGYIKDIPGFTQERLKKTRAAYCGEVTMVDTWFGHLLTKVANMNLMEKTAIIFTSDHGTYLGEHGGIIGKSILFKDEKTGKDLWSHSPLYEEVAAIPLFIYIPGIAPGAYRGLTSAIDLMPTVMEYLGLEIPAFVEGKSLLPKIKGKDLAGRDYVISALPFRNAGDTTKVIDDSPRKNEFSTGATITTEEWAMLYGVEAGGSELYHLPSDPHQLKNVITQNKEKAAELHQLLVKHMRETKVDQRLLEPRLKLRIY
jgi:arylsulfatase A-like enzyme